MTKSNISNNAIMFKSSITINEKGVKQTTALRNNVDKLAGKNPQRDVLVPGNGLSIRERSALYVACAPILSYGEVVKDWASHSISRTLFNLTANTQGAFLAARELMYLADKGELMTYTPEGYRASESLTSLLETGVLKEVVDYSKKDAISREAVLKTKMRGIAAKVEDFVINVLETSIFPLLKNAFQMFLVQTRPPEERTIINHPNLTDRQKEIAQRCMDIMETEEKFKDQLLNYQSALVFYKDYQDSHGITVDLLNQMINETIPGPQQGRKNLILKHLINYFNLIPPSGQSLPKPLRPVQPHNGLEVRALTMQAEEESSPAKCAVKYAAAQVLVHSLEPQREEFTQKIRVNLQDYEDKDAIDTRQRAKMLSEISPLPLSYEDKSMTSPRIYSEEADNLFSCRKSMRMQALKGLGAVDVDMKSCHTYILLAQWGKKLPLLKQAMEKGTLWDLYKTHYQSLNYPFHKKAVKAIHYASVLGGGKDAFLQAIHRHNLDNPLEAITNPEELISIHKKSPIYKELKKLLRYIDRTWHGKDLDLKTGEKFKVKGYRKYKNKKTGELITCKGNLLTALSAYLQSKEVLLMSYLILKTRDLYTPLLWQHDGLTIIPKQQDYLSIMQSILDEACSKVLGSSSISIPLEVTPL